MGSAVIHLTSSASRTGLFRWVAFSFWTSPDTLYTPEPQTEAISKASGLMPPR